MRKTTAALLAVTALSLATSLVLAIGWMNDRSTLRTLRAELAAANGAVAARPSSSSSATATATASPAAEVSSSACPGVNAPPAATSAFAPAYPQIKSVADSSGRVWFASDSSTIKVGTALCFTVRAVDPMSRPLQYKLWLGDRPNQTLVCDWGGPTCRWTANLPQGVNYTPYQLKLTFAVRSDAAVHRLGSGACFQDDACDDTMWIQFTLSAT